MQTGIAIGNLEAASNVLRADASGSEARLEGRLGGVEAHCARVEAQCSRTHTELEKQQQVQEQGRGAAEVQQTWCSSHTPGGLTADALSTGMWPLCAL